MLHHDSAPIDDTHTALARQAAEATLRTLEGRSDINAGENPLTTLGFMLGEEITYEAGLTLLAAAAVSVTDDAKHYWVMARQGRDTEAIMGRYATVLEATAVAEAWNRKNGTAATYYVEDQEE